MLSTQLSAEDQAMLDQMRADDAAIDSGTPEPTAESEQTEAAEQETTTQPAEKPARQTMVPHGALHEEREARKRSEAELRELRERYARLDERTNLVLQKLNEQQAPKPEEPAIPELEKDPVGHIMGNQAALRRQLEQQQQLTQQQQAVIAQQLQAKMVQDAVVQQARALETRFKSQQPDYDAATNFLRDKRIQALAAYGFDETQAAQQLEQEAFALAVHAIQRNANPAALLYEQAKIYGYAPPTTEAPVATSATATAPEPAQKLERIAAGQRAGRSLGDARGSGPVPLTAQRLLEMSDKDFDQMMKTPEGRALLGT